ncbi:MAG: leucine-rich repeat protein [Clostridia bacterium]|nr:leucine-rich repeat protein [Clostridia bacterium]
MKKRVAVFLALLFMFNLLAGVPFELPVFAASSGITGDCTWTVEGTTLTISGSGAMADYSFSDRAPWQTATISSIQKVIIEPGVTNVGNYAFHYFSSLTSVELPDTVTTIGNNAFQHCTVLPQIELPKSLVSIGASAFYECDALTSVTIPDRVTSIGTYAFSFSDKLASITLPTSLTKIGADCFSSCSALKSIVIPGGVTTVGSYAFYNCGSLSSVIIPNSVTTVWNNAFYCCRKLKTVMLGKNVEQIGNGAFSDCDALSDVWYAGTEEEREQILVDVNNPKLASVTWHYDACILSPEANKDHVYDDPCDEVCNFCDKERIPPHLFDYGCDTACNGCGFIREPQHYTVIGEKAHGMQNCNPYPFTLSNGWYVSTNKAHNSSSTYTITAMHDCTLEIHYMVCSEKSGDRMTIKKNSSLLCSESGEVSEKVLNVDVVKGDVVEITYSKNYVTSYAVDCIYFKVFCDCLPEQDVPSESLEPTCTEGVACSYCGLEIKPAKGHTFDHACDVDCNECGDLRTVTHDYSVSDFDDEKHWMKCSVCGAVRADTVKEHVYIHDCDMTCDGCDHIRAVPDHVFSNYNDLFCNVCGQKRDYPYTIGDFDGKQGVDMDDAVYLLFHFNFPEDYPNNQPTDLDRDGEKTVDDAIYLLYHVFFPDRYVIERVVEWQWPLPSEHPGAVVRRFSNDHTGIDISVGGLQYNGKIPALAVAGGKVVRSGYYSDWGNLVVVDHGDGYLSYYAHLDSMSVSVGDLVSQGDEIGKIGATGSTDSVKLHFVLYAPVGQGGASIRVDPLNYLAKQK